MTNAFITPCNPQLKWGRGSQGKSHLPLARAALTHTRHKFHCYLKTFHAWSTLSFDFHPEFSIKIIQRLHFITWARGNLQAIKLLPVSVEMFSRWTSGVEVAEHEMKCPWLSALPFVQKGAKGIRTPCIVKRAFLRVATNCSGIWNEIENRLWMLGYQVTKKPQKSISICNIDGGIVIGCRNYTRVDFHHHQYYYYACPSMHLALKHLEQVTTLLSKSWRPVKMQSVPRWIPRKGIKILYKTVIDFCTMQ